MRELATGSGGERECKRLHNFRTFSLSAFHRDRSLTKALLKPFRCCRDSKAILRSMTAWTSKNSGTKYSGRASSVCYHLGGNIEVPHSPGTDEDCEKRALENVHRSSA